MSSLVTGFLNMMLDAPLNFLPEEPSLMDYNNRVEKAWQRGADLKLIEDAKKYAERPDDSGEESPSFIKSLMEQSWVLADKIYGEKVSKQLKKICPYDGTLLRDMVFILQCRTGLSKEEVSKKLASYSEKDWEEELALSEDLIRSTLGAMVEQIDNEGNVLNK